MRTAKVRDLSLSIYIYIERERERFIYRFRLHKVACGGVHNLAVTEPDQSLASSLATLANGSKERDL